MSVMLASKSHSTAFLRFSLHLDGPYVTTDEQMNAPQNKMTVLLKGNVYATNS